MKIRVAFCCHGRHALKEQDIFYYFKDRGIGFIVQKKLAGYTAAVLPELSKDWKESNAVVKKILISNFQEINTMLYSFQAVLVYEGDRQNRSLTVNPSMRRCLTCYKEENYIDRSIPENSGFQRSRNIVVIGTPGTGKTTYLEAIRKPEFQKEFNKWVPRGYQIHTRNGSNAVTKKSFDPTRLEKDMNYVNYEIGTGLTGKQIYVWDIAGEFTLDKMRDEQYWSNMEGFIQQYVDGVLVICDPRIIRSRQLDNMRKSKGMIEETVDAVLQDIQRLRGIRVPVCYCMSSSDTLKTICQNAGELKDYEGETIMTKDAPVFRQCHTVSDLQLHNAYCKDFFMEHSSLPIINKSEETCFMFSSGQDRSDNVFDYTTSRNIELPLLYLLNQIGTISLEEKDIYET